MSKERHPLFLLIFRSKSPQSDLSASELSDPMELSFDLLITTGTDLERVTTSTTSDRGVCYF